MREIGNTVGAADVASVQGAMLSDVGAVRDNNEDAAVYVIPRPDDPRATKGMLALIADGMGGHASGEVASAIAADVIVNVFYAFDGTPQHALAAAFAAANRIIYERASADEACRGMGTTCTAAVIRDGRLHLAHVGDSRAYLLRDGRLHSLSNDQSLVGELLRLHEITPEEAEHHPDRNVILRALGTHPELAPVIWREGLPLCAGDRLLLCSDGLTDLVDDDAIGAIAGDGEPLDAVRRLVDAALAAGGYDNISVGVFAFDASRPVTSLRPTRPIRLAEQAQ